MPHVFRPRLAAGLGLLLACSAARAATDIDQLGRDCAEGKEEACGELAQIAKTDTQGEVRLQAGERLIKERVRACSSSVEKLRTQLTSERVSVAFEVFFSDEVDVQRQADIQMGGDAFSKSALRSMGLNPAEGASPAQAVVEITAVGTALRARYSVSPQRGGDWHYSGVRWKGALFVRVSGGCICSHAFENETGPPPSIRYGAHGTPSAAPFAEALHGLVAQAVVCLAQDIFGEVGVARMAKTSSSGLVRETAVAKLTDQAVLAHIAKTDSYFRVREAAIEKLADQTVLADIAKTDSEWQVRQAAVWKLTDQTVLADVAKTDSDPVVRQAAVRKLTDQTVLADIAKTDSERTVRGVAVDKLTDQGLLADMAKTDSNWDVREAAVAKLTDQTVLADIAKTRSDSWVRRKAVVKLTDQAVLADVAKTDSNGGVRYEAVRKLTDQALLANIAKTDGNEYVRRAAQRRLEELSGVR